MGGRGKRRLGEQVQSAVCAGEMGAGRQLGREVRLGGGMDRGDWGGFDLLREGEVRLCLRNA